jgi:hypothetical protein
VLSLSGEHFATVHRWAGQLSIMNAIKRGSRLAGKVAIVRGSFFPVLRVNICRNRSADQV